MADKFKKPSTFLAVERARAMAPEVFFAAKKMNGVFLLCLFMFFIVRGLFVLLPENFGLPVFAQIAAAVLNIKIAFLTGLILAVFSFWLVCVLITGFLRQKVMRAGKDLHQDKIKTGDDLLEYLDFEAARMVMGAMRLSHLPFAKVLFYKILKSRRLNFAFERLMVDHQKLEKEFLAQMKKNARLFCEKKDPSLPHNETARARVLEKAARLSIDGGQKRISIFTLCLALADEDERFAEVMDGLQILKEDLFSVVLWQKRMEDYRARRARFWERDNLRLSLAQSPAGMAAGGYTALLDRYARDISLANPLRPGGVVLHSRQIEEIEEALIKKRGNGILLVGEPGSGRKSVVYNFANRVTSEESPKALKKLRVMELNMVSLIGNNPDKEVLAGVLDEIFAQAARARNVVIVIPQIHQYIGRHKNADTAGAVDIGGVIADYLDRPGFRVIGITDYEGFHRSIEQAESQIAAQFSKVEMGKVFAQDALKVLKEEGLRREAESNLFIPYAALKEIVKLCDYFLGSAAFPKKAVNLLDDLVAHKLNFRGSKKITAADVDSYFSRKYQVPAGAAGGAEKDVLLNLEDRIHEGLINQKEAVNELANAMRRARAEIKKRKRTIGNFLFLGPTGCGKTETAKQLARVYFGSEKNIIRLNMADYQTVESAEKLIGTAETPGFLTTAVRENPFSLVLIDEIEKANKNLLDIFLAVFDEGEINDAAGRSVDFRHTVIIATSNAGAEYIREAVNRGGELADLKDSLIDNLLNQGIFKPEFLNRFDALVLYRPLNIGEIQQVAMLTLSEIQKGLRAKRIEFKITEELAQKIGEIGFDPVFGGRALRRAVQDKVENPLAKALLSGKIKAGDVCEIDCQAWEVFACKNPAANSKNV